MSENSKIEWTDATFNPWEGCQKVGPGCDHCYAEARNARFGGGTAINWGPGAPRRRTSAANWRKPLAWNAREFFQCNDCGHRGFGRPYLDVNPGTGGVLGDGHECEVCRSRDIEPVRMRVFCASLADVFDNAVPAAWRRDLAALIEATSALDWQLLTKRIGNAAAMLVDMFPAGTPDHVWLGATVVNQEEADRDIEKLLMTPARRRFLSMEPLLGPVDLGAWFDPTGACCMREMQSCEDCPADAPWIHGPTTEYAEDGTGYSSPEIDWVIAGGESGPGARPAHPDWPRALRDQCAKAGVPFLFKQHGEWAPGSGDFGAGRFATAAVAFDGRVVPGGYGAQDYPAGASSADGWALVHRIGKRAAGRLLDGVEHNGFPCTAADGTLSPSHYVSPSACAHLSFDNPTTSSE
ncbi:phage Gp37/Gp68 family protein [Burkholderia gladioli]|uniref:phage Gp37/Gp68 family protein n=1 Tax=Burkholderia gladioli TaxID=28095 RepID=UPI001D0FDBB2|nr:phage Gp37/Gp68 family protein [Burkholderia gladioli]